MPEGLESERKDMRTVGQHLLVDLVNLERSTCLGGEAWVEAFVKCAEHLKLCVLSSHFHTFDPPRLPGLTAYVLLDSSHFSVHTYADTGEAAVDLFVCTDTNLIEAFAFIQEILGIKEDNIAMRKQIRRFNNGKA